MRNKELKLIVPISGLGWIVNNLQLDKDIKIRFLDLNGEDELLQKSGFNSIKYKCVAEIDYKFDADEASEPYPKVDFLLKRLESALRIYHPGFIALAGIIAVPNDSPFPYIRNLSVNGHPQYNIEKEKLEKFPDFWKKFNKAYVKKPIAFDMYNKSQDRYAPNDVAIDLSIVLESIFVPEKSRGEKKVFITQGVRILGYDEKDQTMLADLYEYRNSIIHGNLAKQHQLLSGAKYTVIWFEELVELVRKILVNYAEKSW
jgi:hypothetical protein